MRTSFEFDLRTTATPDQIVEVLTDFSANRPKRWPALSAGLFRVDSVGSSEAVVQEGQNFPKLYATWRYDWSVPGTVNMTVTESPYLATGSYHTVSASPAPSGGSVVHGIWDITAKNFSAKFGLLTMRAIGRTFFTRYYRQVFDHLAERPT